jgi:hypothetical protein
MITAAKPAYSAALNSSHSLLPSERFPEGPLSRISSSRFFFQDFFQDQLRFVEFPVGGAFRVRFRVQGPGSRVQGPRATAPESMSRLNRRGNLPTSLKTAVEPPLVLDPLESANTLSRWEFNPFCALRSSRSFIHNNARDSTKMASAAVFRSKHFARLCPRARSPSHSVPLPAVGRNRPCLIDPLIVNRQIRCPPPPALCWWAGPITHFPGQRPRLSPSSLREELRH